MKFRAFTPFILLGLFIFVVGLACGASTGDPTAVPPTAVPPTAVPPTDVPPTDVPTATAVPPTETPVPTEVPPTDVPATEVPPPTDIPIAEAPAYYFEEFDGSASSFYPSDYYYFIMNGPDEMDEDVYSDNGKLVFEIDTEDTYIYLYYGPWIYTDVRIGLEADNLGANSQSISLFCRYDDTRGWIEFNIAGDGTYNILAFDELGGTGYNLLYNGGSTAIKIGKQTNTYVAECIGDEIALYVNDVEVKTMTIPNAYRFIDEGYVGFSVSSFNNVPVVVEMEWFGIEEP